MKEYYDNGKVKAEGGVNKEGERVGSWKEYYESGQVKVEGGYQNGYKMGWWKEYYENGNKKSVKAYMMDQKVGTWKYYDENGELTTQEKHNRASEERINTYSSDVLLLNHLKPGSRG